MYKVRCYIDNFKNMLLVVKDRLQISLGLRVKELRQSAGLSQEKFALLIGMDRTYLASIESGLRNVTLRNLSKLADGFGMTLSDLLDGVD